MKIQTNLENYLNDFNEILKQFDRNFENNQTFYQVHNSENEKNFEVKITIGNKNYVYVNDYGSDKIYSIKKFSKINFYEALSAHYNKTFEWGSLTGVRPTKVAYKLLEQGVNQVFLKEKLMQEYKISEDKAKLIVEIIKNQKCIIKNDNLIDLYINIPICPSRCKYCSFISAEYDAVKNVIDDYLNALTKEIKAVKDIIKNKNLIVRSIYVGGGTPSVLSENQLKILLSELSFDVSEFTVECGRPETITREKLQVLKDFGVTRICVNPQTFTAKTLKLIGRQHTIKDVINAYAMAVEFGFDVNIDLIAGLADETLTNFKKSIKCALEMAPQNITIHTLAVKRGSHLCTGKIGDNESTNALHEQEVKKMIEFAHQKLIEEGYKPYYIYRQKNTPLGLENVGYCQKNKVCLFNVDSMEDSCSIIACGANAVSKRVFSIDGRIERNDNVKFIQDYISRIDEMIARKYELFK